jgi:hypothetical protein
MDLEISQRSIGPQLRDEGEALEQRVVAAAAVDGIGMRRGRIDRDRGRLDERAGFFGYRSPDPLRPQ